LGLLSRGLSNKEIARELYISPNTVKVHLRNIYGKMNVSSRTEATMLAVRLGWVEVGGSLDGSPVADAGPAAAKAGQRDAFLVDSGKVSASDSGSAMLSALARWQRVYLLVSALIVAIGLWLIWPTDVQPSQPFTDRPSQASRWNPAQALRWQSLAQMPTPRSRLALVADQAGIWAIAGDTPSGVSRALEIYTPDEDDWMRGADKPTAVANVGAVALDGKIYVPGGSTGDEGGVTDCLEVYDPGAGTEGTWGEGKRMPHAVSAYAIAAYDGSLYLFGGWNGDAYVQESYQYDPEKDQWSALAPMPTARAFAGAGRIGQYVYVVGGFDGASELDICEMYDLELDLWAECPPMRAPRGGVGVAVIADTLYVIGGGWESYLVENEYFSPDMSDPARGVWRTFPSPLLQEWRNLGVVSHGTYLYAIGGWDGDFLSTNQAYRALYRLYLPRAMGQQSSGGSLD